MDVARVRVCFGTLSVVFEAADQSFLPRLVPGELLTPAFARIEQADAVAPTTGPMLAGLLVRLVGAPVAMLVDAVPICSPAYSSFQGHGVVILQRADEAHAMLAFWTGPERAFSHWYVNFQEPFRRTPQGIETFDHELDLIVWPDGRREWKDVDAFEQCVATGRFTSAEAGAIRAEAARVTSALDSGGPWWDQTWSTWSPPGTWTG